MEYITPESRANVLCCECGIPIEPNPTNQCIACIRAQHDITAAIIKQYSLYFCKNCERYLDPPESWIHASLESRELLKMCLKKIKGLNQVRLIDAVFIWTEPHSKRIKVKLVVQKEIISGAVLQQDFTVEFTVNNQMCTDCHRVEAKDFWRAVVQVRQNTDHKATFYYLEQLILKHKAHDHTLGIKPANGGLDFFYTSETNARKFMDFLIGIVPCKWNLSKKLVSHDVHSNIYNYKHSFSVEIVPVCKDNIVCLSSKLSHHLGGINQICIVMRVTSNITLIDPNSAQIAEVSASLYWRLPFKSVCSKKNLREYIVLDITDAVVQHFNGQGHVSHKHKVVEVWVQSANDIGNGEMIFCRSHLGHILKPGDSVLGIDLRNCNINDENYEKLKEEYQTDVVLVKKLYADKSLRNRRRKWRLMHLGIDNDNGSQNDDYIDFLEDLEEDPEIRTNVNIYKNRYKLSISECSAVDDIPIIGLEEMLDDLVLDD